MCTHIRVSIKDVREVNVKKREFPIRKGIRLPFEIVETQEVADLGNSDTISHCILEGLIDSYLPPFELNPFIKAEQITDYWNKYLISYVPLKVTHYQERDIWWSSDNLYLIAVIRHGIPKYGEDLICTSLVTTEAHKALNDSGLVHNRKPLFL